MTSKFYVGQKAADYLTELNNLDAAVQNATNMAIKDEGVVIVPKPSSINFSGSSIHATSDTNGNVTVAVDSVSVVSVSATAQPTVVAGYNWVVSVAGIAGLQGQTVASFEITPSWLPQQTVAASGNSATVNLLASGANGAVLSVSVVAIDSAGNRSPSLTKSVTIVANSAPQGTPVISAPTQIPKTTSATISFSGVQDTDGTPWSFSIYQDPATPYPFTFSKTTGIQPGELVTVTAPDTVGAANDPVTTFSVYAVDVLGSQGVSTSCSITILASTVVGIVEKATGGAGGTWGHIDVNGNDITSPTTSWFNSYGPYLWQAVTVAGRNMVKIPKFYYKSGTISGGANNGLQAYWISDLPRAGFSVHPAFMKNGSEISQFYIDATATSLTTVAMATARSQASALNTGGVTGFQVLNYWQWQAILYAAMVELKTMANVEPLKAKATTSYRGVTLCGSGTIQFIVDGIYLDSNAAINVLDTQGNGTYVNAGTANVPSSFSTASVISTSYQGAYVSTFITTGVLGAGFFANTPATATSSATSVGAVAMFKPSAGGVEYMAVPWQIDGTTAATVGTAFSYQMTYGDGNSNLGIVRMSKT